MPRAIEQLDFEFEISMTSVQGRRLKALSPRAENILIWYNSNQIPASKIISINLSKYVVVRHLTFEF